MLKITPTQQLTGVTIKGDQADLMELVDSIYGITGLNDDDIDDPYFGVKNRLLGICYDIRHAGQGTRKVILEANGMDRDFMKWHQVITPTENVCYAVDVLFPEAIFVATSTPCLYESARHFYGGKNRRQSDQGLFIPPLTNYSRDKANLDVLCAAVWQALGEAIGEDAVEQLLKSRAGQQTDFQSYVTAYIDRCNLELLKTPVSKRRIKLISITKRILKKPQAYSRLEQDLRSWARHRQSSIYQLKDPSLVYPAEIEW